MFAGIKLSRSDRVFDTNTVIGSTTIILPKDVIVAIFSKVEGLSFDNNGQRLIPCNSTDLVPFTITMGSHDFILNPQEYLFPFSVAGGVSIIIFSLMELNYINYYY